MTNQQAQDVIDEINKKLHKCNTWELNFIHCISDQIKNGMVPSDKQSGLINNIYAKVYGGGKYQQREII